MKTRIHVNRHRIAQNKKDGGDRPVVTCKTYKENQYGKEVEIQGPSKVVYRPEQPLSCGAVLWIETDSDVVILK